MKRTILALLLSTFVYISSAQMDSINLGNDTSLCPGACILLDGTSGLNEAIYGWSLKGGTLEASDTSHILFCPQLLINEITVSSTNAEREGNGEDPIEGKIVIRMPIPISNLTIDSISLCKDSCMTIEGPTGGDSYIWTPNNFFTSHNNRVTDVCPLKDTIAILSVNYGASVDAMCNSKDTLNIKAIECDTLNNFVFSNRQNMNDLLLIKRDGNHVMVSLKGDIRKYDNAFIYDITGRVISKFKKNTVVIHKPESSIIFVSFIYENHIYTRKITSY